MASAPATDAPREEPPSPYERIGGREVLQRIVDRFYDLMDSDPSYAALRAMHAPDAELVLVVPQRDASPVTAALAAAATNPPRLAGWTRS